MSYKIETLELKKDYKVQISFEDKQTYLIDLRPFLMKGFAKELLEKDKFSEIYIESGGGLAWPNGFDICPIFLRNLIQEKQDLHDLTV